MNLPERRQVQHAVLQPRCGGDVLERALRQALKDRVGNVAHARLQRQQVGGQAAQFHLLLQETDDVAGNAVGRVVRRGIPQLRSGWWVLTTAITLDGSQRR